MAYLDNEFFKVLNAFSKHCVSTANAQALLSSLNQYVGAASMLLPRELRYIRNGGDKSIIFTEDSDLTEEELERVHISIYRNAISRIAYSANSVLGNDKGVGMLFLDNENSVLCLIYEPSYFRVQAGITPTLALLNNIRVAQYIISFLIPLIEMLNFYNSVMRTFTSQFLQTGSFYNGQFKIDRYTCYFALANIRSKAVKVRDDFNFAVTTLAKACKSDLEKQFKGTFDYSLKGFKAIKRFKGWLARMVVAPTFYPSGNSCIGLQPVSQNLNNKYAMPLCDDDDPFTDITNTFDPQWLATTSSPMCTVQSLSELMINQVITSW